MAMGHTWHNQQQKGGYARKKWTQPYAKSIGGGPCNSKTNDAGTAIGLGVQLRPEHDACEHDMIAGNVTTELARLVI